MIQEQIKKTRSQRIAEEKRQAAKARNVKVAGLTLAAAISTSVLTGGVKTVKASESGVYIVQAGDTLDTISKKFKTTVELLKSENGITSNQLYIGQKLEVPTEYHSDNEEQYFNDHLESYKVLKGDNLYRIALKFNISVEQLKKINGLTSDQLKVGQVLTIPDNTSKDQTPKDQTPKKEHNQAKKGTHTVAPGDNLYRIALKYNVTVEQLKKQNGLTSDRLCVGQVLTITSETSKEQTPKKDHNQAKKGAHTVAPGDNLYRIALKYNVTVEQLKKQNGLTSDRLSVGQVLTIPNETSKEQTPKKEAHTVAPGDNLYRIALKYNITVEQLKKQNGLTSDRLSVGQVLTIPNKTIKEQTPKNDHNQSQKGTAHIVTFGDNLYRIALKYNVTVDQLKKQNGLTSDRINVGQVLTIPNKTTQTPKKDNNQSKIGAVYTVAPGDTLWGIAKRFNVSVADIKKANGLKNDFILIGQKLIIRDDIKTTTGKVIGAADKFTVEFNTKDQILTLKVPFGTAHKFEALTGRNVILTYKNDGLIYLQF
ncbi:LysM peptidoglycan-binding domain-containing protein [Bacillus aquiflavi]|uniref:LysM peptidoglycan-binding domain-containing protein n=1 Tax=Bacillus aquiflavi TaxID=2672567 RepID=UPI001CA9E4B8|nr:LysM peptidoglycan-binding domain-containing protein [Bacillus aquiflavi]UAC47898.1 LysM peptidoglycan-binding domain-containing protein [Bacillus aquiflavi]